MMGAAFTTMVGFALTFYIRSFTVKKVVDISFDLKKDTFIYLLLVAQAFVICLGVPLSYLIGAILFLLIMLLYRKEYYSLLSRIFSIVFQDLTAFFTDVSQGAE